MCVVLFSPLAYFVFLVPFFLLFSSSWLPVGCFCLSLCVPFACFVSASQGGSQIINIFHKGGREQYWVEGAVVALLYVAMSLALLGTYAAPSWKRYPIALSLNKLCFVSKNRDTRGSNVLYTAIYGWYFSSQVLAAALQWAI